jgi:hypothetical protein
MIEHLLGRGVLSWDADERQSDRYGTVRLFRHHRPHAPFVTIAGAPVGTIGDLLVRVIETRKSNHVGDVFRKIYPIMPEAGEQIILGVGILARHACEPDYVVGVIPLGERDKDWLKPKALYRAHDQTVDLIFRTDGTTVGRVPTIPKIILGSIRVSRVVGIDPGKHWPSSRN